MSQNKYTALCNDAKGTKSAVNNGKESPKSNILGLIKEEEGVYRKRMNHEMEQVTKENIAGFIKMMGLNWVGHL